MLYTKKTFSFEYPPGDADVVLLGIPWDSTEIGYSTKHGPTLIREAIRNTIGYDTVLRVNPFTKLKFSDLGDLEIAPGSWKSTEERIIDTLKDVFSQNSGAFPVILGGDHLVTLGVLEAFPYEKITVVHFDAHRDIRKEWQGEQFSHLTWARQILNDSKFSLVQIGCRAWDEEEEKTLKNMNIQEDVSNIKGKVYITVDMDVFSPEYAPDVGTPEPEGMSPQEFFKTLEAVSEKAEIIGLDVVECAGQSLNSRTAQLAAHVIKRVLALKAVKSETI